MAKPAPKPKLLIVVHVAFFFWSHRLPLALHALNSGYAVHIAMPFEDPQHPPQYPGLEFHHIDFSRHGTGIFSEFKTLLSLWRLYTQLKPDLIHHVAQKAVIYGGIAARCAAVPAVVNMLTGMGFIFSSDSFKARSLRPLIWRMYRLSLNAKNSCLIVQNKTDQALFTQKHILPAANIRLIRGSGVDLQIFQPSPEPQGITTIILPTRLLWDKGVAEFVDSARLLRASFRVRFVLVGWSDQGNLESIPVEILRAWVNCGLVEWWGAMTDMAWVYKQAHIVVLPSYREGLPKVLLEAGASQRALVTTDVPGCNEVVTAGKNGLLVRQGDATDLAAKLAILLGCKSYRQRLAQAARFITERDFALPQIMAEFMHSYAQLLVPKSAVVHNKRENSIADTGQN